jgi:hypothetical protein
MTPRAPASEREAAPIAKLLGETLHEMQCRRRHPHPVDHSWGMQGEQLAAALAAHPTPPPPLEALANVLREMDSAKLEAESGGYMNMEWRTWPCSDIAEAILASLPAATPSPDAVRRLVDEQAEDEGLWFLAQTAPEAYLQQELRRLHAAIETAALPRQNEPGLDVERPPCPHSISGPATKCLNCGESWF